MSSGKMELTKEEKEHIRAETKQIVTCAVFCENGNGASRQRVDRAVIERQTVVKNWQRSCQAERTQATR